MIIEIEITDEEYALLNVLAKKHDVTVVQYASNIVKGFAQGQIRGVYQRVFNNKSNDQLKYIFGPVKDLENEVK